MMRAFGRRLAAGLLATTAFIQPVDAASLRQIGGTSGSLRVQTPARTLRGIPLRTSSLPGGGVVTTPPPTLPLIAAASNARFGQSSGNGNSGVPYNTPDVCWINTHYFPNAITAPIFAYYNNFTTSQGEYPAGSVDDFVLSEGIQVVNPTTYVTTTYPLTFGGSRTYSLTSKHWVFADPLVGVTIPKGAVVKSITRTVYSGKTSGSYTYPVSHFARPAMGEGSWMRAAGASDCTLGGYPGDGFVARLNGTKTGTGTNTQPWQGTYDSQGAVSISVLKGTTTPFSGSSPNVAVLDPLRTGSGVFGFANTNNVQADSNITQTAAYGGGATNNGYGTGYSTGSWIGLGAGGLNSPAQMFGPAMIIGTPTVAGLPSLLADGDSLTSNNDTAAANATPRGDMGAVLRGYNGSVAYLSTAIPGLTAYAHYNARYDMLAMLQAAQGMGLRFSSYLFALGTNDLAGPVNNGGQFSGTNQFANALTNNYQKISARVKSLFGSGIKVYRVNLIPRVTSSDSFATTANQTPVSATLNGTTYYPFTAGNDRDTYNASITASGDTLIDLNGAVADPTATDRWKITSAYSNVINPGVTSPTDYGTHIADSWIPTVDKNLTLPAIQ